MKLQCLNAIMCETFCFSVNKKGYRGAYFKINIVLLGMSRFQVTTAAKMRCHDILVYFDCFLEFEWT